MIPIKNRRLGAFGNIISKPITSRPSTTKNNSNLSKSDKISRNKCIELYTCPGIGDAMWPLFFLLKNTTRPIKVHTLPRNTNFTSHFLSMIKNIVSVDQDFSPVPAHCKNYFGLCGHSEHMRQFTYYDLNSFDELAGNQVFMTCNQHIDYGRRLEEYLPNMQIDFKIPWNFDITPYKRPNPYIVMITAAAEENISTEVTNQWTPNKWNKVAREIKSNYPNIDLIWAGTNRDLSMFNGHLDRGLFSEIKTGLNAHQIVNLMHGAIGHIGYQNGVSVISVYEHTPTYMFYFPRLNKIPYSWTPPELEIDKIKYNYTFFNQFDINHLLEWVGNLLTYDNQSRNNI